MKGTKLIGLGLALATLCIGARADVAADMAKAKAAYYEIKGDKAKAAQVQAMFEAIPNDASAQAYVGYCLYIRGKRAEAIEAYKAALALGGMDQNFILNVNGNIADAYYAMGQYAEGVAVMEAAIAAYKGALAANKVRAKGVLARGLLAARKYAEANEALVDRIVAGIRLNKTVDAAIVKAFDSLHPEAMTAEAYKTALTDILKATPATEANAEFLGRVKSELEKMK